MKKLIALTLVLSFLVGGIVGCEKEKPMPKPGGTGGGGGAAPSKAG